jgi:hypothetical protein
LRSAVGIKEDSWCGNINRTRLWQEPEVSGRKCVITLAVKGNEDIQFYGATFSLLSICYQLMWMTDGVLITFTLTL